MMVDIARARADLRQQLAAALTVPVLATMPARLAAPCVFVREADEFIRPEPDGPFGSVVLQWDGVGVVAPAGQDEQINAADQLATELVTHPDLNSAHHIEVGGYSVETHSGQPYLIVPFTITTTL